MSTMAVQRLTFKAFSEDLKHKIVSPKYEKFNRVNISEGDHFEINNFIIIFNIIIAI